MRLLCVLFKTVIVFVMFVCCGQRAAEAEPYRVTQTAKVGGEGGFDFVVADSEGRRLYVPRSGGEKSRVTVFDLDTLKSVGEIAHTNAVHGVAIDNISHHGFTSSKPVVMFDTKTLETIKTIDVEGNPDEILFDPFTQQVFVFSHRAPNATVLNGKDGSVVGTIDLAGAPEQAVSDGQGHVYVDLEDKDSVAVVDAKTLKVTARYDLGRQRGRTFGIGAWTRRIAFCLCAAKIRKRR